MRPGGESVRAGAVQLNSTNNVDANLDTADRLVRDAAGRGAELVVLPEKWNLLGAGEEVAAGAQPLDGPSLSWARNVAAELGIDLVAGSIVERMPDRDRGSNTSVHIGPDGEVQARYCKLHMFDVEVDGVVYAESDHEQPGDQVVVSELAGGARLGMSICYDVRFPELYRSLSDRGARDHLRPGGVHPGHHTGSLGGAPPGASDREPVLCHRPQPDRPATRRATAPGDVR